jgi:cytosine/adenosine deaminase-related metal-dependent hydrolase/C-terminal processing protease CtpA/Prc
MPDNSAKLPIGPKYVLQGRVVTMGPGGIIPRGSIYVDSGDIVAVQKTSDPSPEGFENAPRINTGHSIYPGFIELHNHLSYNAMPLWDVPQKYTNSGQWKNHEDYRRLITKPSQVLGRTPGVVESLVRFAECKCLLGGVTTSQGITLASAGGIVSVFQGLVRNVEQPDDPDLPRAGTRIANPDTDKAAEYLERLQGQTCYLQHLSEGIDQTARSWFHRLQLNDGEWAVNNAFCGIHSTALHEDDFRIISQRGGTMVWSPLSNFLLYGKTADIKAIKESGILMGIGCDWAPSGSKNLLGELKTAWLVSEEEGGVFTPEEIVAMATINAAKILKWDHLLGSIEPGKRADLVCFNGQRGDDFMRVINARETSVTLVIINGFPRAGQRSLIKAFQLGKEEIRVGRSLRVLHLEQDDAHPLVRNLTLTEATKRLQQAMKELPSLAADLDTAQAQGLFSGSTDAQGSVWHIVTDFEEDDRALEEALGVASLPLADFVEPMELEGITVADDSQFLRKLVAARNLPEYVKKGLPLLYGTDIPLPESAEFLLSAPEPLPPQILETQDLKSFLRISGELSLDERRKIVEQALLLLEQNYVHLPFKRAMHAIDPVQRLRLLRHRLDGIQEDDLPPAEIEFHNEMTRIFNSLRDLHTTYRLPSPFKQKTAWLPFFIEQIHEQDRRKYIVSNVVANAGPDTFVPGVEVLYWNGTPMQTIVEQNADKQAGSNTAARLARGLNSLTIRPLAQGLPPDEEWVTLRYIDLNGKIHEWTQEWLVFEPGRGTTRLDPESLLTQTTAFGMDSLTDDIQETKKVLFAGKVALEEIRRAHDESQPFSNTRDGLATFLPSVFRARSITTDYGTFGYIRIFTFNVRDARVFVDEFVRLVEQLPQDGLIIDVRGNGGGLIHAAEYLLQVLTPKRIEPEPAQFINTAVNLRLCKAFQTPTSRLPGFSLGEWVNSISNSVETGAVYSIGFPITSPDSANAIGQKYFGPSLLITDALCYSATDIFAAGFQDHGIGPILGLDPNTGAGGANVWSHHLLVELMRMSPDTFSSSESSYSFLPHGSDLRVAIRRTIRVGNNAGTVVEDLGIVPDYVHHMTQNDVLSGNRDLIWEATRILSQRKSHSIRVAVAAGNDTSRTVQIETHNLDWINLFIDGRPRRSYDVRDGITSVNLGDVISEGFTPGIKLEIQGFKDNQLVAVSRKIF